MENHDDFVNKNRFRDFTNDEISTMSIALRHFGSDFFVKGDRKIRQDSYRLGIEATEEGKRRGDIISGSVMSG